MEIRNDDDPGPLPEAEPEPEALETQTAVRYALETLKRDPRTEDLAAGIEQALPMIATMSGIDPSHVHVGDMLQAVSDAWQAAQVRAYHEDNGLEWSDPETVPAS